jgi:hypothetical protein
VKRRKRGATNGTYKLFTGMGYIQTAYQLILNILKNEN